MATIYLVSILHRILIYSKYILNITLISRPFMLIIILEFTCNMIVHIHSKYKFVNSNVFNYIY
jgi:hypothetical protein